MKRIAVLTSGGDSPGMNAAIRAVVRTGYHLGAEVIGIEEGYRGIFELKFQQLTVRSVSNILKAGGTILGSSRFRELTNPETRKFCYNVLKNKKIDGLVIIGGEGSCKGAEIMSEESGIPVVALPGTIDNDMAGLDETIGFDTAVNVAMDAVDRIRDTAQSHGLLFFVEVMGRTSSHIAAQVGLACGAEGVLASGIDTSIDELAANLQKSRERGKKFSIVIVAEGETAGRVLDVAKEVYEKTEIPYRICILGHIQRGGSPSARDRVLASRLGYAAVNGLFDGKSSILYGFKNGSLIEVPFSEIQGTRSEKNLEILETAKVLSL